MAFKMTHNNLLEIIADIEDIRSYADEYVISLFEGLSVGAADFGLTEERYPEEFARAREGLRGARGWIMEGDTLMRDIIGLRQRYPRSHWWLWIEDLHA